VSSFYNKFRMYSSFQGGRRHLKDVGSRMGSYEGATSFLHTGRVPRANPLCVCRLEVFQSPASNRESKRYLAASKLMHAPMGTKLPLLCDDVQHAVFLRRSSVWGGSPKDLWDCPDRSHRMGTKSTIVFVSFASSAATLVLIPCFEQRSSPACAIQR